METNSSISPQITDGLTETIKEAYFESVLNAHFEKYVPMVLLVMSTVGNSLSYAVYSRAVFQPSTTAVYFRMLAIADIVSSNTQCWYLLFNDSFTTGWFTTSEVFCKLWMFVTWLFRDFSAWILILISIERLLMVSVPHKAKFLCTKKKAKLSLIYIFVLLVSLNFPLLLSSKQQWLSNSNRCSTRGNSDMVKFMITIFRWIDIVKYTIFPFSAMIFCNVCIIILLVKAATKRRANLMAGNADSNNRISSMTVNLLLISFAFLICSAPISVFYMFIPISLITNENQFGKQMILFRTCSLLLATFNNCINVFLYCAAGGNFRRELRIVICGRKKKHQHTSGTGAGEITSVF